MGSRLEIVKIKNIKNGKRKQETSFLVLFTNINLFCSLYRSKGRKFHFSWALWNLSHSLSNEEDFKKNFRYFLNTFCSRSVFFLNQNIKVSNFLWHNLLCIFHHVTLYLEGKWEDSRIIVNYFVIDFGIYFGGEQGGIDFKSVEQHHEMP